MFEIDKNIYCSWQYQLKQKKNNFIVKKWNQFFGDEKKKVSGLLFGYCGVGKSRLINNLCNTDQKVGIARKTITKELYQGNVKLLNQEQIFSLFDSPGIQVNDIQGSYVLRRGLKYLQWNVILLQTKLQARFQDTTLTQLVKLSKIFGSSQKQQNIYLVSHADILDECHPGQKKKILDGFKKSLEIYLPNKKVILFSNVNSNFQILGQILYSCAAEFNPTQFQIEDKKFCRALGYQNTKDSLEDQIRHWYEKIKRQPRIEIKAQMLQEIKLKNLEIYQTLKHHVNQMQLVPKKGIQVSTQQTIQKPPTNINKNINQIYGQQNSVNNNQKYSNQQPQRRQFIILTQQKPPINTNIIQSYGYQNTNQNTYYKHSNQLPPTSTYQYQYQYKGVHYDPYKDPSFANKNGIHSKTYQR